MQSFSPRNGEVILKSTVISELPLSFSFQSPQWGSNSKDPPEPVAEIYSAVSVPAMGK